MSPIGIERFGRDHWSTFAYLETRVVDGGGQIECRRMRCDIGRHPQYVRGLDHFLVVGIPGHAKYPTRCKDGEVEDHDDWDCMDDLEAAGLLVIGGTGMNPIISMTDRGWRVAEALRQHRGKGTTHAYQTFDIATMVDAVDPHAAEPGTLATREN